MKNVLQIILSILIFPIIVLLILILGVSQELSIFCNYTLNKLIGLLNLSEKEF